MIQLCYYFKSRQIIFDRMGNICVDVPVSRGITESTTLPHNSSAKKVEQDEFKVQNLSKMSIANPYNYYWIDPNINNPENAQYLKQLKSINFIMGYNSVARLMGDLKLLQPAKKCKVVCAASLNDQDFGVLQGEFRFQSMYLFCQNKNRAQSLKSSFPKIRSAFYDFTSFKTFLSQEKGSESNFNLFFFVQDHMTLMNKCRINFQTIIKSRSLDEKAKKDFIDFAKKFYPENSAQIETFRRQYSSSKTLEWLSKPGFFSGSIMKLPKATSDPKRLAYIRFPFKEAYDCIFEQNRKNSKLSDAFVIITPSEQQKQRFKTNMRNFVMFTSFVKGFSKQRKAKEQLKSIPGSIMIRIQLRVYAKNEKLDFGYCLLPNCEEREDIIFNVNNIYEIKEVDLDEREVTLQYGALATLAQSSERPTDLNTFQSNLLKNHYYLSDVFKKIGSQASVLSMSGYFSDSLAIYNKKGDEVRKTQQLKEIDRNCIDKGDAYCLNSDFQNAQKQYKSVQSPQMKLIAKVHLAELYLKMNDKVKFQECVSEITKNISEYKSIQSPEESFKAQNFLALDLMNKGDYKEASRRYKVLKNELNEYYDYKFEGIPLAHEIQRNRAACETKLQNYTEALNLLESTKSWQKVCEGSRSPGLIITQNLIKSIHESKGQPRKAEQCTKEIKKIWQNSLKVDNDYLIKTSVIPEINQSAINILTTGNVN